jgi:hypothetical protein
MGIISPKSLSRICFIIRCSTEFGEGSCWRRTRRPKRNWKPEENYLSTQNTCTIFVDPKHTNTNRRETTLKGPAEILSQRFPVAFVLLVRFQGVFNIYVSKSNACTWCVDVFRLFSAESESVLGTRLFNLRVKNEEWKDIGETLDMPGKLYVIQSTTDKTPPWLSFHESLCNEIPLTVTLGTLDIAPPPLAALRWKLWGYKANVDNFENVLI